MVFARCTYEDLKCTFHRPPHTSTLLRRGHPVCARSILVSSQLYRAGSEAGANIQCFLNMNMMPGASRYTYFGGYHSFTLKRTRSRSHIFTGTQNRNKALTSQSGTSACTHGGTSHSNAQRQQQQANHTEEGAAPGDAKRPRSTHAVTRVGRTSAPTWL